jgi:hypothetical protein
MPQVSHPPKTNPAQLRASRLYYERNGAALREKRRARYAKDPQRWIAWQREYNATHREQIRAKEWQRRNKDRSLGPTILEELCQASV